MAVPTLELTVHLRARLPLESDWVLGRFATRTARDGLLEEDGELWSRDGLAAGPVAPAGACAQRILSGERSRQSL